MKERCRHERHSWLIAGGYYEWYYEWCYVCGAFRALKHTRNNVFLPNSKWHKPSGDKNKNPWEAKK